VALPIIGDIVAAGAKAIVGLVETIAGNKTERDAVKGAVALEMAKMAGELETTYRAELELQRTVMVAELEHGDNYTKRARPTIIYAGLAVALFDGIIGPLIGWIWGVDVPKSNLLPEFWYVWGGVCGIYAVGRTREKIGSQSGKLLNAVFGNGS
jgi:hypothetical protein